MTHLRVLIIPAAIVLAVGLLLAPIVLAQGAYRIPALQETNDPSTSPHAGEVVRTIGVVAAVYPDQGGYVIMDPTQETENGWWNGIFVYAPGHPLPDQGDHVAVTGRVEEANGGFTRIVEAERAQRDLGELFAAPTDMRPGTLGTVNLDAERYEGVWVYTPQVVVTERLGDQEWMIKEYTEDGTILEPGAILVYSGELQVWDALLCVSGVVWFTGDAFKLRAHPAGLAFQCSMVLYWVEPPPRPTDTPTPTNTPVPPTPTNTPVPPTDTPTPVEPTDTPTPTPLGPTATPTSTRLGPTDTPTSTPSGPTNTPTSLPSGSTNTPGAPPAGETQATLTVEATPAGLPVTGQTPPSFPWVLFLVSLALLVGAWLTARLVRYQG